jgi:membrane-bound lytic murein transglycosylase A
MNRTRVLHTAAASLTWIALALLSGCVVEPVQSPRPTPPRTIPPASAERVQYQAMDWSLLPGWRSDELVPAWQAFLSSCKSLARRSEWQRVCAEALSIDPSDGRLQRSFLEGRLQPYQIKKQTATGSEDTGLITGYYEPLLDGSLRESSRYSVPLYGVPKDLLTVDIGSLYPELAGKRIRGRVQGNKVVPYFSRSELADGKQLRGQEVAWVADPLDAFFLQIQGSGRVRLDSGETIRILFADVNGHPYRSIGRYLIDQGELTADSASVPDIRAWMLRNPSRAMEVFNYNASVVFFRTAPLGNPNEGPIGALGVPLTPERSLAVDPRYVPLGAPVFLATTKPLSKEPLQRLMLAQDTGGAIKGMVRADFFWGLGRPAGEQAGRMRQQGNLWLLWPKGAALPAASP